MTNVKVSYHRLTMHATRSSQNLVISVQKSHLKRSTIITVMVSDSEPIDTVGRSFFQARRNGGGVQICTNLIQSCS